MCGKSVFSFLPPSLSSDPSWISQYPCSSSDGDAALGLCCRPSGEPVFLGHPSPALHLFCRADLWSLAQCQTRIGGSGAWTMPAGLLCSRPFVAGAGAIFCGIRVLGSVPFGSGCPIPFTPGFLPSSGRLCLRRVSVALTRPVIPVASILRSWRAEAFGRGVHPTAAAVRGP